MATFLLSFVTLLTARPCLVTTGGWSTGCKVR